MNLATTNFLDTSKWQAVGVNWAFTGEEPAKVDARITGSTITAAGEVTVTATQAAAIESTLSNKSKGAAQALTGANSTTFNGILSSNKVSTTAVAVISTSTVSAEGITVGADDAASIAASTQLRSHTNTINDGGAAVISDLVQRPDERLRLHQQVGHPDARLR